VSILRRVAALKVLQNQSEEIDVEYKKERIMLEIKYRLMKDPLLTSRSKIVSGEVDVPKSSTDESPGTDFSSPILVVPSQSVKVN
jgi:Nucleosome assembly protein (NAP)